MIKYHEVIEAAHRGAGRAELAAIAGGQEKLDEIMNHLLNVVVVKLKAARGVFKFKVNRKYAQALADLKVLQLALDRE